MNNIYYNYFESPIGLIEIGGTSAAITALNFVDERRKGFESHPNVDSTLRQLDEYFSGTRRDFNVDLSMDGTDFQKQVWVQLMTVPFGQTASYGDIAAAIGNPKAVRAVGGANGRNPVSIIVPCHRIIGSDNTLTGYGSGLWRKEWLLKHEGSL
jgi:methylated-DNA-[protein]-cysteine S-methyltransferase